MAGSSIEQFLSGSTYAVVGASRDRSKYGNKVLRTYMQHGREVFPVNPNAEEIEGLTAYADLKSLPMKVDGISIITPPQITEQIIEEAVELEIPNVWMQPGAESTHAIERALEAGLNVVSGGPCLLVVLGFRD